VPGAKSSGRLADGAAASFVWKSRLGMPESKMRALFVQTKIRVKNTQNRRLPVAHSSPSISLMSDGSETLRYPKIRMSKIPCGPVLLKDLFSAINKWFGHTPNGPFAT